ncbi:2690_t:CDS:2, partial [Dentiscutata heterogama]
DYILDINRLNNLLKNNEIHFLSNLFPPANVELDEEVNEYLDNNEVECSNPQGSKESNKPQETKDHYKIESTETTCPRNNLLRKIGFFIMIFIIIGLFLYVSVI